MFDFDDLCPKCGQFSTLISTCDYAGQFLGIFECPECANVFKVTFLATVEDRELSKV